MENQKVIEIIQAGLVWANWTNEQKEAFIIAGNAVKKQIPIKAKKSIESQIECPMCFSLVDSNYCKHCGQRISF
jgi:hypothetical protein